jgi:uncharacterized membrane protein
MGARVIIVAALFLITLLLAVLFYRRLRDSFSRRALFFLGAVLAVVGCFFAFCDFVMLRDAIQMTQRPSMLIRGPFYITILLTVLFYRRLRKLLRRRVVLSFVIVLGIVTCSFASFHFTTLREFLSGSREYQFAKRVKNAAERAVVNIATQEQESVFALSNQDLYRRVAPSVVLVSCPGKGYGTGFFYGRDGIIVTNHHVMQGVTHAEIVTHRGQRYPVHGIVAEDAANDLILLSTGIPPDEVRALTGNTSADAGDRVVVVSRHKVFTDVLAEGIVSAAPVRPWVGIRLATPLTYGASGSPVCNSRGEVVAIIRAGDKEDNQTGFAIPSARLSALAAKNPYPLSQMAASETLDTSILTTTSAARDTAAR